MFINPKHLIIATAGMVVCLAGIAGNLLVVIAVLKRPSLRSTTNYLLVNLAISDVTSLIFAILAVIPEYVTLNIGASADFLCKFIMSYSVPVTATIVSILTLTVLSIERYHAVVKPMETWMRLRRETFKYAVIAVWITSFISTLPLYINGYYRKEVKACRQSLYWNRLVFKVYQISIIDFVFFIASGITGFCYIHIIRELYFKKSQLQLANNSAAERLRNQRKRHIVKLSLTITLVFAVFLLPFAILITMKYFNEGAFKNYFKIAAFLVFSEAGINPFLYAFQSTNFRQAFKDILKYPCVA